jgi:transcriptional regulator with XRE-family HTH domain
MDSINSIKLPERLRALRKERKMKQKTLGEQVGLSNQAIHDIETGRRATSPERLVSFADFFSVSVDYLLGRTDIKEMAADHSSTPLALPHNEQQNVLCSPDEQLLIDSYRRLDEFSRGRLVERSLIFLENTRHTT